MAENKKKTIRDVSPYKTPVKEQEPQIRARNFDEVILGYNIEEARLEGSRCLQCKRPLCATGCPVGINIPAFVREIVKGDFKQAYTIITEANLFPSICGRVCPQETQCEAGCVLNKNKYEAVGIGRLERFIGDLALKESWGEFSVSRPKDIKVAIIGSGPSGLACAADLSKAGCEVVIYEALHTVGGVLIYGIPEFRLPKRIVTSEVENLRKLGVKIELNRVIGKIFTIEQLLKEKGFNAAFIGTGAGYPSPLGIPGECLNGVMSANEFLTRVNLMQGYEFPLFDTPSGMGENVVVIGCGNTAMDAARVALRMNPEKVSIIYRRSELESPARREELYHAKEEGVEFNWLTEPVEILDDGNGWVKEIGCVKTRLSEPDESGRKRAVPIENSYFVIKADTVIYALGTEANPIIRKSTAGLRTDKQGYIEVDPNTHMTSIPGVFAGGDIASDIGRFTTVIHAMKAGRKAAKAILDFCR